MVFFHSRRGLFHNLPTVRCYSCMSIGKVVWKLIQFEQKLFHDNITCKHTFFLCLKSKRGLLVLSRPFYRSDTYVNYLIDILWRENRNLCVRLWIKLGCCNHLKTLFRRGLICGKGTRILVSGPLINYFSLKCFQDKNYVAK